MAPPPWTTKEQRAFLQLRMDTFCLARSEGSATRFRYQLYLDWFQVFPERSALFPDLEGDLTAEQRAALGKAIVKRKKSLRNWYHNHSGQKGRRVASSRRLNLNSVLKPKGRRALQAVEVYCRKYYKGRVKEDVDRICQERGCTRKERFELMRRLTKEAFDKEDEAVKREIQDEVKASRECTEALGDGSEGTDGSPVSAVIAQLAVDNIPTACSQLFDSAQEVIQNGYFLVIAVVEDANCPGKFASWAYHSEPRREGKTFDFGSSHDDFKGQYVRPFVEYTKKDTATRCEEEEDRAAAVAAARATSGDSDAPESNIDAAAPAPSPTPSSCDGDRLESRSPSLRAAGSAELPSKSPVDEERGPAATSMAMDTSDDPPVPGIVTVLETDNMAAISGSIEMLSTAPSTLSTAPSTLSTTPSTDAPPGALLGASPSSRAPPASPPSPPAGVSTSLDNNSGAVGRDSDGLLALLHAGDQNWDLPAELNSASDVDLSTMDLSKFRPEPPAFPWQQYGSQGANSGSCFENFSFPTPPEQLFAPPMPTCGTPSYPQGMSPADASTFLAQAHLLQQWSQYAPYDFFCGPAFPNGPDMSLMSASVPGVQFPAAQMSPARQMFPAPQMSPAAQMFPALQGFSTSSAVHPMLEPQRATTLPSDPNHWTTGQYAPAPTAPTAPGNFTVTPAGRTASAHGESTLCEAPVGSQVAPGTPDACPIARDTVVSSGGRPQRIRRPPANPDGTVPLNLPGSRAVCAGGNDTDTLADAGAKRKRGTAERRKRQSL